MVTDHRGEFTLDQRVGRFEVVRLGQALEDELLVCLFDILLQGSFHLHPELLLELGQRRIGAAILGELIVQRGELLLFDRLHTEPERHGFPRQAPVRMRRGVGLGDLDEVPLLFSDQQLVHLQPEDGHLGTDPVELAFLLRSFERREIHKPFHVQYGVIALGQPRSGRRGLELALLLPQRFQRSVHLLLRHRARVRLQ